jgi:predicted metal-dependent hydrolase
MAEGRACFRRGEFYEAHEHWEAVWDEADDPERRWIQGMIQVATGLHKVQRGRSDIALGLLRRALDKLRDAPAVISDIDVAGMVTDAREAVAAIDRGERVDPGKVRA